MKPTNGANISKNLLTTTESTTQPSNLPVLTYQEQLVVTTETLVLGYGTRVTNIRTNFEILIGRVLSKVYIFRPYLAVS